MTITPDSLVSTFLAECPQVRLTEPERRKLRNLFQTALDKPWHRKTTPAAYAVKDDDDLLALIQASVSAFQSLPKSKQEEMLKLQQESWVRGEMGIGTDKDEARYRASLPLLPGFMDPYARHVKVGDRVVYRPHPKRPPHARGVLREAFQDGDAIVDCDDGQERAIKWKYLYKEMD